MHYVLDFVNKKTSYKYLIKIDEDDILKYDPLEQGIIKKTEIIKRNWICTNCNTKTGPFFNDSTCINCNSGYFKNLSDYNYIGWLQQNNNNLKNVP